MQLLLKSIRYSWILVLFLTMSCNNGKRVPEALLREALDIAVQYASSTMDSSEVATDNNNIISIRDQTIRYVIDPLNVFYANIDNNPGRDVIISIDSLHDPYLMPAWHIVLNKSGKELKTVNVIRSDMRVLGIEKGIITAEIPTHTPASPLYYCSECRDTVEYVLEGSSLVRKSK